MADVDSTEPSAQTWKEWLIAAMKAAGRSAADLVRLTKGGRIELNYSTISKWTSGKGSADPERVIIVAELLNAEIVPALTAAGHDLIANRVEGASGPPGAGRRIPVDDLAALRASDLPEHLKLRFEHEYTETVAPMLRATEAVKRRLAAEIEQALRDQETQRGEEPSGDSAESA